MPNEPKYDVVWPLGHCHWDTRALNERVPDLNGKVIAELWDYLFRGEQIFPMIRQVMARMFPGIRFIQYDKLGDIQGANQKAVLARLPELLREFGVDAAITGVGA